MMKHSILAYFSLFVLGLFSPALKAEVYEVEEFSLLSIHSAITPATYDYLKHNLAIMPPRSLIIVKLNTPGGLVTTTKDIITLLGEQDRPVAFWITPEGASAASAGAIIASAAHFIFMAPGTNMGAATPVGLGEDLKASDGRNKALNDLTAMVRSLSQLRGRPAKPFEDMIKLASSFTDQEALKEKIITGVVSTQAALIDSLKEQKFKHKGVEKTLEINPHATVVEYTRSWGQEILDVLANPSTAYFLFLAGMALIYFEFQAPGGYVMGGLGLSLLVLAAIAFQVLPLNWGALGLMCIGIVLLILEIFVTSYGVLGIGGVASLLAGSLFLFNHDSGFISIEYSLLLSTFAGIAVSAGTIAFFLLREKKNSPASFFLPQGTKGEVMAILGDHYQVKVRGEIWKATSSLPLHVGEIIRVVSVNNEQLVLHITKD